MQAQVLQPIGNDRGNQMLRWPVPNDFPAGPSLQIPPGMLAPAAQAQCWTPYGVTWFKPAPGGPIVYGPGGSYVAPAPQLPTGARGPVIQATGVAMPGPGGAGGAGGGWPNDEQTAALLVNGDGGTGSGKGWLVLLAVAGLTWMATRKRRT